MLNRVYDFFNTISITAWIVVVYIIKEKWTFCQDIHYMIVGGVAVVFAIGMGALSLLLTKFLGKENLEKCIEVEQADASFLPTYIGYFLVAFGVPNMYQLLVAMVLISVFLYFVRWQYFNATYLLFGYHCYHITTEAHTKLFVICRKELRSPNNLRFENLRRITNTTYIERGK